MSNKLIHPPLETPWGRLQSFELLAPGIFSCSTSSHGGYFVDSKVNARIPSIIKAASHCGNAFDGWYEEDCDWAIVVVCVRRGFDERLFSEAVETLKRFHPVAWTCLKTLKKVS